MGFMAQAYIDIALTNKKLSRLFLCCRYAGAVQLEFWRAIFMPLFGAHLSPAAYTKNFGSVLFA